MQEGSPVILNGTASYNPDAQPLTYQWTQLSGPAVTLVGANTSMATFTAPSVGAAGATITFDLTVMDGSLTGSVPVSVVVTNINHVPMANAGPDQTVNENAAVTLNGTLSTDPDLDALSFTGVSDPNDQAITITFTAVTQDELVNGLGDGDTSPDAAVSGNQILLRAERAGTGNGRVYQVQFTATDDQGGSCNGSVKVAVPHSKKDTAVDGGQLFNSFGQ